MKRGPAIFPLAPAHLAGLGAFQASLVLAFIDVRLASIPLLLFLILCFTAPFLPRFSFYLPITSRGSRRRRAVALTFDDGPEPLVTPALLDLLSAQNVPAAFFVTGARAEKHPGIIRDILSRGHCIGNHSYGHSTALMLMSQDRLRGEVERTQSILAGYGIDPLAFRPVAGITNPRLWRVLLEQGMFCLNFSCRAFDAGNRRVRSLSGKILRRVKPGDIILLHDAAPETGFNAGEWLREIGQLIAGLRGRGFEILPLERLIARPVMKHIPGKVAGAMNPAGAFYDGIAGSYDDETDGSGFTPAAAREGRLFTEKFLPMIKPQHRVLEIGAGTGRYTLPLARTCREVTAVELSENMMALLKNKAAAAGAAGIIFRAGDIESMELEGSYDAVCSFSSFEYISDLPGLIQKISTHLSPGGVLYFTTAHRSPFRFFTQLGNAMRQGIWLHARTRRSVARSLGDAGFTRVNISTHVMKIPVSGGMLMEVSAVR
jgi:peptidoglycan-N-acetylglucosamine deacetylase